jgi:chromosome partitioning protein
VLSFEHFEDLGVSIRCNLFIERNIAIKKYFI